MTLNDLNDDQTKVLLNCTIMEVRSCELLFEDTTIKDWKNTIDCLEMGLVEIFIGDNSKGEACPRMRLTHRGRELFYNIRKPQ